MLVNCIDNRQNQLFSEMSLRDVMELPIGKMAYIGISPNFVSQNRHEIVTPHI